MAKVQNLTVRLEKGLIEKIEEAQQEKTDESAGARKLITMGTEQTQRARALEDYWKGRCTVWKAARCKNLIAWSVVRAEEVNDHPSKSNPGKLKLWDNRYRHLCRKPV